MKFFKIACLLFSMFFFSSYALAAEFAPSGQISMFIHAHKATYSLKEKIPLRVEVVNSSDGLVVLWPFIEIYYHEISDGIVSPKIKTKIEIIDEKDGAVIFRGKMILKIKPPELNDFIAIAPSERYIFPDIELQENDKQYGIKRKGKYSVMISYENHGREWIKRKISQKIYSEKQLPYPLLNYWDGMVISNRIEIEVK